MIGSEHFVVLFDIVAVVFVIAVAIVVVIASATKFLLP